MQERIQKRIWNINCDSQVLLKYIAVFLGNQGLRAHNLRSLETQKPSGKKSLAQFVMWEEANLDSELTLPVYCNCKLVHEHLSCDGFEVNNSR